MRSIAELLRLAKARVARPGSWTQGALARTVSGAEVFAFDSGAARFCMRGAVEAIPCSLSDYAASIRALEEAVDARCIEEWNDAPGRTHPEVLTAFDRAIALEEENR